MSLAKQRGTAIIVALFMVSLVAVIALTMMTRLNRDIRRTQLLLQSTQADLYAQGSLEWALDSLRYAWINHQKNELVDRLPLSSSVDTLKGFQIASVIDDAQALFNLNNLMTAEWMNCFQRLLLILNPDLSAEKAQDLTQSTANWIAPISKNSEEDLYYTHLPSPYRNPHRPMAQVTEFRLVKGVSPTLYRRVLPYITALPSMTPVNVNTASAPVLQSLSSSLTAEAARNIEAYRKRQPFLSVDQFLKTDLIHNQPLSESLVTVTSQYFLIKTQANNKLQHLLLTTLAHRNTAENSKATLQVLWQNKGGA